MIILRGENGGMGIKKNTLIFRWIVGGSKTTGRPFEEVKNGSALCCDRSMGLDKGEI